MVRLDRTVGWLALCLLVPVLSGCIAPPEIAPLHEGPVHSFRAVYEDQNGRDLVVSFSLEQGVFAYDGEHREALLLEMSGDRWQSRYHFDGDARWVREEFHGSYMAWKAGGLPPRGMLWPWLLMEEDNIPENRKIDIVHHGGHYSLEDSWYTYYYAYGDLVPYQIESYQTLLLLKRLDEGDEMRVDPWPDPPRREKQRDLLFPGADEVWAGRPASFQTMFDGLMDHSQSVREMVESGGCLDVVESSRVTKQPWMTVIGQEVGEPLVVHRTRFQVLEPTKEPAIEDGDTVKKVLEGDSKSISPYPKHRGEIWEVRWTVHPYEGDSVEYEKVREAAVGYKSCDEIGGLPRAVSLQEAWGRARKVPADWDEKNVDFRWNVGFRHHMTGITQDYRFRLIEPGEDDRDRTRVDLLIDAEAGHFRSLRYDDEVVGHPDT